RPGPGTGSSISISLAVLSGSESSIFAARIPLRSDPDQGTAAGTGRSCGSSSRKPPPPTGDTAMHARRLILALALAGASTLAQASPDCAIRLKAGDDMRFDQKSVTVSASCQT